MLSWTIPHTEITIARIVKGSRQGDFLIPDLPKGVYTIVVKKNGYIRQVIGDVVVVAGELTELETIVEGQDLPLSLLSLEAREQMIEIFGVR